MTIGVPKSISCWIPASLTSVVLAGIALHETLLVTCSVSEQKAREAFKTGCFFHQLLAVEHCPVVACGTWGLMIIVSAAFP